MTVPDSNSLWIGFGFLGQAFFGLRFLVQWLYSEKRGKSRIPDAFWYLSVAGGVTLLTYAVHRHELVFIIGESITLFVFLRNVHFLWRPG